ncbi:hypothetical protein DU002_01625 [Corallincola holothuriorum]|uniref:Mannosyl-glycoprotein endo-beta-N-acetylglucosamidase-like domain-containing protein n=1 Tax=Corallincola holothuriorum TaxID=2282215 RepID=A0A368NRF7_9GAMM|nr:glucosaminidase domain-containing protein [Corallincola holothuriorum]RCU52690.1 hypothetical protein DU002_01625 [Corallincola holothuriorum]
MVTRDTRFIFSIALISLLSLSMISYFRTPDVVEKEEVASAKDLPDFAAIGDVKTKKIAFFRYLKPFVMANNAEILEMRRQVEGFLDELQAKGSLSAKSLYQLQAMAVRYRIQSFSVSDESLNRLLKRLDILPYELVLVQAANESAWGTSRFAREGYNLFGLWCYRQGCGMVPKARNDGAVHEVARFASMEEAVYAYFLNLNTHPTYKPLRDIRQAQREEQRQINANELVSGLVGYSERGEAYVEELAAMLRYNAKLFTELTQ